MTYEEKQQAERKSTALEFWTPDKVEILEKMYSEGYTADEIGQRLLCSRSQIVGKIYRLRSTEEGRLKFPSRPSSGDPRHVRKPYERRDRRPVRYAPTVPKAASPVKPKAPTVLLPPILVSGPGPGDVGDVILKLQNGQCKWPEGDPFKPGFSFCGHPQKEGSSYCEHHFEMAKAPKIPKHLKISGSGYRIKDAGFKNWQGVVK